MDHLQEASDSIWEQVERSCQRIPKTASYCANRGNLADAVASPDGARDGAFSGKCSRKGSVRLPGQTARCGKGQEIRATSAVACDYDKWPSLSRIVAMYLFICAG